ncbi:MAG TPA: thioredoxin family protein [Candidatus Acidoferrum sp.]|nr:thioredoxin family protein [Candidatus Acidoferrum sp.]
MKSARVVGFGILLLLGPILGMAQSTFEPLNHWKAALQSGNEAALAAFYSKVPPARVQTSAGTVDDPEAEARYWSAAVAKRPISMNPKLLTVEPRQAGLVEAVLRIEMTFPGTSGGLPFAAAVHQLWQRQGNDWLIVATSRSDLQPNPPRRLPEPLKPKTDLYAPPEEAKAEIDAALASAAKDHKRVILVFGANWCYDCHVLDTTFHSKTIAPLVNANYHVVHVNVGDEDKNLDLAEKYGVPLKKGIPGLAVLDPDGRLVYSQKEGEFENSVRIGPADVTAFLKKWAAPPHAG